MYYRPGLDRQRGSQLELLISVPPASTLELGYEFEKAILRYTEYPPDANRGRDVAPAVIRLLAKEEANGTDIINDDGGGEAHPEPWYPSGMGAVGRKKAAAYLRTTPLMLPLPTPDFSMPYNVIILTSTVIALAFGTIYNMLVRRFVGADEAEGMLAGVKRKVERIRGRVAGLLGMGKGVEVEGEKKVQ